MKKTPNPAMKMKQGSNKRRANTPNLTGRVDILAIRLLEELVCRKGNPVIGELFAQARPTIERELASKIGPRTKRGRAIRDLVASIAQNHPPHSPAPFNLGGPL